MLKIDYQKYLSIEKIEKSPEILLLYSHLFTWMNLGLCKLCSRKREISVHAINKFSFSITSFKGIFTSVSFQEELWESDYYALLLW